MTLTAAYQPQQHTQPRSIGRRRTATVFIILSLVLIAVCLLRLAIGTSSFGIPTGNHIADQIRHTREFRLALGLIVGAALSISGVALQALLRNPLAEPYILGLSTGAAVGMMAQWWIMYQLGVTFGASQAGAVVGASLSMLIVYLASRRGAGAGGGGGIDPLGLLLNGVVLSIINGALVMLFYYMAGPGGLRENITGWMMGYLNTGLRAHTVWIVAGITATGFVLLLRFGRAMDIATLSDAEANSLGVNLAQLRTLLFVVASILAAGAVVLAGPIAFVGLICPHLARLLLGPRHQPLLITSALLGAALVVLADVIASLIALTFGIGMMPIGIFTAIVGGPAFLWMLRPSLGRAGM